MADDEPGNTEAVNKKNGAENEENKNPNNNEPEPTDDKEEKMEVDEEHNDKTNDLPIVEENSKSNTPVTEAETEPLETIETETKTVSDNQDVSTVQENLILEDKDLDKNIPENFAVMQNNKESCNKVGDSKRVTSKKSNIDITPTTNGNEESRCSIDEQSVDVNNCYCGQSRNLNVVELQCGSCNKWFHEQCIQTHLGKNLPFMTYYSFFCKHCNPNGIETFSKKQPSFSQMCGTAIANMMQSSIVDGKPRKMFSKDKDIIPYIVANWEYLTTMQRRIKQSWHATVAKALFKDSEIFTCEEKSKDASTSDFLYPMFGLVNQDLTKIKPSYDVQGRGPQKFNVDSSSSQGGTAFTKGRSSKRKFFDSQVSGPGKKVKSDLVMPKLPPNGYPSEHPFNKDGYRYILAEPDEHAPFRKEFDESQDTAGKPIPGWLYRRLIPSNVLLALHDRAPQLKVSEDRLSVTGEKGYCMVRATHGANKGTWYYEVTITEMPDGAATRLGWGQYLANLQGPLGYDKFGYSWRSRKSTKFHESRGYHYADEGYGLGDTLGLYIHLPKIGDSVDLPPILKDKPLVKFKSYLYYEEKDEVKEEVQKLKPLPGSKIMFYKNGKSLGTAFENIYAGTYFPAVSLYKGVTVTLNFGPNFKYPPKEKCTPVYDLADVVTIDQVMTDLLFFTENMGKLHL